MCGRLADSPGVAIPHFYPPFYGKMRVKLVFRLGRVWDHANASSAV